MRQRKGYWIGGTVVALIGVGLVRLLAPELAGLGSTITFATGHVLVIAGIGLLACATRRKPSEAFITLSKDAG
jgi:hypothetical protein